MGKRQLIDKEGLVIESFSYVQSIARNISKKINDSVDYEDLVGYGKIGLMEAAERFDPRYEASFHTFAYYRIKGAIYDGLRKMGWLSRSQYAKQKFEEGANDLLANLSGGKREGVVTLLEDTAVELKETISALTPIYILSLDAEENIDIEDKAQYNPEKEYEMKEERELLQRLIKMLPSSEKELIVLYYYNDLTLEEIGKKLGFSKSWTSRLHTRIIIKLREMMANEIRG